MVWSRNCARSILPHEGFRPLLVWQQLQSPATCSGIGAACLKRRACEAKKERGGVGCIEPVMMLAYSQYIRFALLCFSFVLACQSTFLFCLSAASHTLETVLAFVSLAPVKHRRSQIDRQRIFGISSHLISVQLIALRRKRLEHGHVSSTILLPTAPASRRDGKR